MNKIWQAGVGYFSALTTRSTLVALLVLMLSLGLAGMVLNHAYYTGARQELESRLSAYAYALLEGTEYTNNGTLEAPESGPTTDFSRPRSGLYATMVAGNGFYWKSGSLVGSYMPTINFLRPGEDHFSGPILTGVGSVFIYSASTRVQNPRGKSTIVTVRVAESTSHFTARVDSYRRTLFAWLMVVGMVVLLLQWLLLRWTLSPLRRVSRDLRRVERGEVQQLGSDYPRELSGLTRSINTFIRNEREHMQQYQHTLADLAHSLKTPLAVMRSRLESITAEPTARQELHEQIERMDGLLAYQLSRAASGGAPTFAKPVLVLPCIRDIVEGLEKVYAERQVVCEFAVDENEQYRFYGGEGDLMELFGNLLDNAFKWAESRVLLTLENQSETPGKTALRVLIEDDGPGVDPALSQTIFQRGVRGDERVNGHGQGLAIVADLVRAYGADIHVTPSRTLKGACFCMTFRAVDARNDKMHAKTTQRAADKR